MAEYKSKGEGGTLLLGLMAVGVGLFLVGLSLWGSGESFYAPRWVIAAAGGVFFLAGLAIFGRRYRHFYAFVIALLITLFGAAVTWVSFGPGEREFTSTISLPFLSVSGPGSDLTGRICFAPGAILLDGLAIFLWFRFFRDWLVENLHAD